METSPNQSNVLLYASTTLSLVSLCLFVVSSCYFQSVINVQNEQLVLLTDQQDDLINEVATLKDLVEEDTDVSYRLCLYEIMYDNYRPHSSSLISGPSSQGA